MNAAIKNRLAAFMSIIAGFAFLVAFFSSTGVTDADLWLYSGAVGFIALAGIPLLLGKEVLQGR